MITIDLMTLFPSMCRGPLDESMLKRARQSGQAEVRVHDTRSFTHDKHRITDDRPFGGGAGMVMTPGPLVEGIEAINALDETPAHVIYLTPEGRPFNQSIARELAAKPRLLLVSGHYEGIDERVREGWIDDEISIGDFVLTNGTLPALVLMDAVIRLQPGVLGNDDSAQCDSFENGLLEGPQYTRPEVFRGMGVPDILLSGHHARIDAWRHQQSMERTRHRRADLLPTT